MMGWAYGANMPGWGGAWGLGNIIFLVVLVDLVLLGLWFWKQLMKK